MKTNTKLISEDNEMNVAADPKWAKDFKKEIMEKYNLSLLDAACITGMMCKIVRERGERATEWVKNVLEDVYDEVDWEADAFSNTPSKEEYVWDALTNFKTALDNE